MRTKVRKILDTTDEHPYKREQRDKGTDQENREYNQSTGGYAFSYNGHQLFSFSSLIWAKASKAAARTIT